MLIELKVVFLLLVSLTWSAAAADLVVHGDWRYYEPHEGVQFDESTSSILLDIESIRSRHAIKHLIGIDFATNDEPEHVFIVRENESLLERIDSFIDSFTQTGFFINLSPSPMPASQSERKKYQDFILSEVEREDVLRTRTREATRAAIEERQAAGLDLYIGVGETRCGVDDEWIETSVHALDLTYEGDFKTLFKKDEVSIFRAEHVLEHLTIPEAYVALVNMYRFLTPQGGRVRIAVPDYLADYEEVKKEPGYTAKRDRSDRHKVQFTVSSLTSLLLQAGFERVEAIEYFVLSEDGESSPSLISAEWDEGSGRIKRSSKGIGSACSIIIDAFKGKRNDHL